MYVVLALLASGLAVIGTTCKVDLVCSISFILSKVSWVYKIGQKLSLRCGRYKVSLGPKVLF